MSNSCSPARAACHTALNCRDEDAEMPADPFDVIRKRKPALSPRETTRVPSRRELARGDPARIRSRANRLAGLAETSKRILERAITWPPSMYQNAPLSFSSRHLHSETENPNANRYCRRMIIRTARLLPPRITNVSRIDWNPREHELCTPRGCNSSDL